VTTCLVAIQTSPELKSETIKVGQGSGQDIKEFCVVCLDGVVCVVGNDLVTKWAQVFEKLDI